MPQFIGVEYFVVQSAHAEGRCFDVLAYHNSPFSVGGNGVVTSKHDFIFYECSDQYRSLCFWLGEEGDY